uniref:Pept_C1 domain-containing protein n=1 Tax=Caenorhabditis tropicalis TaxID=1561998 RepID=A0A1I7UBU8_9PELO
MKTAIAALLVGLVAVNAYNVEVKHGDSIPIEVQMLRGQELVDYVNKQQTTFKTKLGTYFSSYPDTIKKQLMGAKMVEIPEEYRVFEMTHPEVLDAAIPDSFDSRAQWPNCPSISKIRDQSSCGSCWAVSAAETISDRICIASNGQTQLSISADDINACCGMVCGNGCNGGYPIEAWRHYVKKGYVTGGSYQEKTGCKPYPYPPCEHHVNGTHYKPCPSDMYPTDKCERSCQAGYALTYQQDLHFGQSAYAVSKKATEIQKEIMTHGPVEVAFTVYEDFEHYTGGVYVHTAGPSLGGHAVKMLGWGVDNGTPYWLCANSWNEDWGENGYFRIIRGVNECGIESGVVGGIPKL